VATRATVLDLLTALQHQYESGYLFVSHDLEVVRYLAPRAVVGVRTPGAGGYDTRPTETPR